MRSKYGKRPQAEGSWADLLFVQDQAPCNAGLAPAISLTWVHVNVTCLGCISLLLEAFYPSFKAHLLSESLTVLPAGCFLTFLRSVCESCLSPSSHLLLFYRANKPSVNMTA